MRAVARTSHFRHAQDDGAEERIVEVERVGGCDLAVCDRVSVVAVESRELGRSSAKLMLCVERLIAPGEARRRVSNGSVVLLEAAR